MGARAFISVEHGTKAKSLGEKDNIWAQGK